MHLRLVKWVMYFVTSFSLLYLYALQPSFLVLVITIPWNIKFHVIMFLILAQTFHKQQFLTRKFLKESKHPAEKYICTSTYALNVPPYKAHYLRATCTMYIYRHRCTSLSSKTQDSTVQCIVAASTMAP